MNEIVKILELIIRGIDPITGEVLNTEKLRENNDFKFAIRQLGITYLNDAKLKKFDALEISYPEHVIIKRERFFYTSYNDSANIIHEILGYKLNINSIGQLVTGGPSIDKITDSLKRVNYSYLVFEGGEIIQIHNGINPFSKSNNTSKNYEKMPKPTSDSNSLISSIMSECNRELFMKFEKQPIDIDRRLSNILEGFPLEMKEILNLRFKSKKSSIEIGNIVGMPHIMISQLISDFLKLLENITIINYLLGDSESFSKHYIKTKNKKDISISSYDLSNSKDNPIIKELHKFEYSHYYPIAISEIARRVNNLSVNDNVWKITYKEIAAWLVFQELFEEFQTDNGKIKRYPTIKGNEVGIELVERESSDNRKYEVVVCNIEAQKYIVEHIGDIIDYVVIKHHSNEF